MGDLSTLINSFYQFIVHGITEYLFIFNVHYVLAYIVILIGLKYTNNLNWWENLFGKFKKYCVSITGLILATAYLLINGGDLHYMSSILQSYVLTMVLQDIFIVLAGFLINKLTFGVIKFNHQDKSINVVVTKKDNSYIILNKKDKGDDKD